MQAVDRSRGSSIGAVLLHAPKVACFTFCLKASSFFRCSAGDTLLGCWAYKGIEELVTSAEATSIAEKNFTLTRKICIYYTTYNNRRDEQKITIEK